jgi:hypothetical protein
MARADVSFGNMVTPDEVIAQLARNPGVVRALIDDVPRSDRRRRPREGKWSAHEHACHLSLMEPMWAERAERILREDRPTIVSYEPDTDEAPDRLLSMNLDEALDAYEQGRKELVGRLSALPSDAWNRGATHTAHAHYSFFLMCRHIALHDMLHAFRIEESVLGSHWPTERTNA